MNDLFKMQWEIQLDASVERHLAEIHAMAESARRCIGQRHRRNQEKLGMAMVRAVGGVKIARGGR